MKPAVSIVCSAYNHGKYIRDALDSFLMQKCDFPYEIIVHDDASDDGTADIIREYSEKYPEKIITILQTENQYSKDINSLTKHLYSKARGKYTAICEGDDYWTDPLKLQKQVDALEKNPNIDICASRTALSDNGKTVGYCAPSHKDTVFTADDVILGGGDFVATSSLMLRTEVLQSAPEFKRIFPYDYAIQIHGALRGGLIYLNEPMSVYRIFGGGSWTVSYFADREKRIAFNEQMKKMLRTLDKETEGKHSDAIRYKLKEIEFYHYNNEGEFKKMLSSDLREVYHNQSVKSKLKICIRCMFPSLVRKHRERKIRKAKEKSL